VTNRLQTLHHLQKEQKEHAAVPCEMPQNASMHMHQTASLDYMLSAMQGQHMPPVCTVRPSQHPQSFVQMSLTDASHSKHTSNKLIAPTSCWMSCCLAVETMAMCWRGVVFRQPSSMAFQIWMSCKDNLNLVYMICSLTGKDASNPVNDWTAA
jgi:hypothetical protein